MNFTELQLLGAYRVAGSADIYSDGKHLRLGDVAEDDTVDLTDEGTAFVRAQTAKQVLEILSAQIPLSDVTSMPNDLSALDAALAL